MEPNELDGEKLAKRVEAMFPTLRVDFLKVDEGDGSYHLRVVPLDRKVAGVPTQGSGI